MNMFERITKNTAALAEFLSTLPVADAPWDTAFAHEFCEKCPLENCDICPNEEKRNNTNLFLNCE